ncbi:MAG: ribonuclease D [Deltaproteobacteria bacterium]|nr:ribonuclease D [Deltaproteobacteria bacterium]MBN2670072.1 ribonuclease D [Deltaproteobacteria bacterium]
MNIKTQAELEAICRRMYQAGCMGIDSEFIPENTYYPQLALVQLAVENDCCLVDPLSNLDLSPIEDVLQSERVISIVHAGAQDMAIFFYRSGKPPKMVFDTQLAASFVGMGHQVSYASMVQQLFGVSLKKGQSYTDWMKRPLLAQQVTYALEDVAYLIGAYEKLAGELENKGRLGWVTEELRMYEESYFYLQHAEHPEKRVKKSRQLKLREQAILETLANWREEKAQEKNLPRKKILPDPTIVDLSRRAPQNEAELFSIRSVGYSMKRYSSELLHVIAQAKKMPLSEEAPKFVSSLDGDQKLLVDFLQFCLKAFCAQEDISSSYVSTKAELEALVRDYFSDSFTPENHRLLTGWRKDAVGLQVLRCLEGKMGVAYHPQTGKLLFAAIPQ